MRGASLAAILLIMTAGSAEASSLDGTDWLRHARAWVQTLLAAPPADRDVIAPPGNIDPQMAVAPPAFGALRIIRPDRAQR
ncbi:MAG TPA: hypothetical protein VJR70_12405 [Stellaceae bacterium]|nr:hypothetical protein [Stellaceae bacterium]